MFLRILEVKNFRSLEDIEVDNLDHINVFIGRNNAGKSTLFSVMKMLVFRLQGSDGGIDYNTILTDHEIDRTMKIRLVFEIETIEREQFLTRLEIQPNFHRYSALHSSPFLNRIEYTFRSRSREPQMLFIDQIRILSEDGEWAEIFAPERTPYQDSSDHRIIDFRQMVTAQPTTLLHKDRIDIWHTGVKYYTSRLDLRRNPQNYLLPLSGVDPYITWLLDRLRTYLQGAFFFNPFRHSVGTPKIIQMHELVQDGSNLAEVLFTLQNNKRQKFNQIENFIQDALPDIGLLRMPLNNDRTEVQFRVHEDSFPTRLHEMGGGIEQLLMIGTVLYTTTDESSLFIEEPETHLHAGAQRFLLEKLYASRRQIFITTHSPIFVNTTTPTSRVYQVIKNEQRTTVRGVESTTLLSETLDDIGVRNSDVLLSDAVIFVEGPGDRDALTAWSEKLGMSFAQFNITVLLTEGADYIDRSAAARSQLLGAISQKSPVPHLFIVDRDQRRPKDIDILEQRLGNKIHVLKARELENYLLIPRALIEALHIKCETDIHMREKISQKTLEDVEQMIQEAADGLYDLVLIKSVRAELGGLQGGFLTRQAADLLIKNKDTSNLSAKIAASIISHVKPHIEKRKIRKIVREQEQLLGSEWKDQSRRRMIAPGEEILDQVYQRFGVRYKKGKDTLRIVQAMQQDEIDLEIVELLKRAITLTDQK